jgi:RNA polymerase sigma-70 factor (ECF subfamily)
METQTATGDRKIECQCNYLLLLARCLVPIPERAQFDPADIVQITLLKALGSQAEFRGQTEEELRAWLRTILRNTLALERRRALPRVSPQALEESACRLEEMLAANQSTPSQRLIREEQLLQLADALAQLPEDQRRAIQLYDLDGHSRPEVCRLMGRTYAEVNGLLIRGRRNLRGLLEPM